MSVKIRLARFGACKRPFYRIVVADSRMPRNGRFIEMLGFYNPMLEKNHENFLKININRLRYWLKNGAQPSERVGWFIKKGLINLSDSLEVS